MMDELNLEIRRKTNSLELSVGNGSGEGGTNNYDRLINKPSIEGVTLQGDKTFSQLGLNRVTEQEIDRLLFG